MIQTKLTTFLNLVMWVILITTFMKYGIVAGLLLIVAELTLGVLFIEQNTYGKVVRWGDD